MTARDWEGTVQIVVSQPERVAAEKAGGHVGQCAFIEHPESICPHLLRWRVPRDELRLEMASAGEGILYVLGTSARSPPGSCTLLSIILRPAR
eukprot:scaffold10084_cov139-Isochrysis_galbana.AAC.5